MLFFASNLLQKGNKSFEIFLSPSWLHQETRGGILGMRLINQVSIECNRGSRHYLCAYYTE